MVKGSDEKKRGEISKNGSGLNYFDCGNGFSI